jgi:CheY-like chemotaxis protein
MQGWKPKILIVDDEELLARAMALALREFDVEIARDGAEALERVQSNRFDAVVTDVQMPGVSGLQLLEVLEQRHPDIARRVIFTTGGVTSPEMQRALESRDNVCLSKPFALDELKDVVLETAMLAA